VLQRSEFLPNLLNRQDDGHIRQRYGQGEL